MQILSFLVAFGACILGKICGMGGGVIIKPVLDALGVMSTQQINFASGCTVLGMSCWSVGKSMLGGSSQIDLRVSTLLAAGAAIGGVAGKRLFSAVVGLLPNGNMAGGIQAALLLAATFATLLYTRRQDRIVRKTVRSFVGCLGIGLALGTLGTFLGIGGGPFNMAALSYFFSMPTKTAAQNSLYIILFSQLLGIVSTAVSGNLPQISLLILIVMIASGIAGSEAGGRINSRMSEAQVTALFQCVMGLVMAICAYNIYKFMY